MIYAELSEHLEAIATPLESEGVSETLLPALRACLGSMPKRSRGLLDRYYGDSESVDRSSSSVRMAVMRQRDVLRPCVLARLQGTLR